MIRSLQIYLTVLLLLNSIPLLAKSGFPQATYHYEPSVTALDGVLQTRVYPGPPNYESVKRGDLAETIWLLKLASPVTVLDVKDTSSDNETEERVREIQLVVQDEEDKKKLKRVIGQSIKLTGTLFHAWSGHHHLKVLMDVKSYLVKK